MKKVEILQTPLSEGRSVHVFWRQWRSCLRPVSPDDHASLGHWETDGEGHQNPENPLHKRFWTTDRGHPSLGFRWVLAQLEEVEERCGCRTLDDISSCCCAPHDSVLLCELAEEFARAEIPQVVVASLHIGQMTALKKRSGGIVAGEILRRLVGRTRMRRLLISALTTRSGCESIAHALQGLTDLDPEATVMSVDGVGAFDLISRASVTEERPRV